MTPIEAGARFRKEQAVLRRTVGGWEPAWVVRMFEPTVDGMWRYLIGYQYETPRSGISAVCVMAVDETKIRAA